MTKDLVILVADKAMESTLRAGLARHEALGIRPVAFDFRQHPNRDGGVRTTGPGILALERTRFSHAMLVLDHEGSGTELPAVELEESLDGELRRIWGHRAKAIVIEPELDAWMWGNDNLLAQQLGWPNREPIRRWLKDRDFQFQRNDKPRRPKEALEAVFPECNLPRSAANYKKIAERISLSRCSDPSFCRFRDCLGQWFGIPS